MKIAIAQINPIVGAITDNGKKIVDQILFAKKKGAKLICFPELALIGYPPEDFLFIPTFIEAAQKGLLPIVEATEGITAIVGTVRKNPSTEDEKSLFNTAAVIFNKQIVGFQDKTLLPDYDVFSEKRYFESAKKINIWNIEERRVGITICEDLWGHSGLVQYPQDPVLRLKKDNPELIINISSSPFYLERLEDRFQVAKKSIKTLGASLIFCNQVGGNDSLIFDGQSFAMNSKGELLSLLPGFVETMEIVDVDKKETLAFSQSNPGEELLKALILGVRDYFSKLQFKTACLGLSGGIDSAVVAYIAKEALGRQSLLALALPSRFTSKQSLIDAYELATRMGISLEEISIEPHFKSFLETFGSKGGKMGVTEENLQARIRGLLLMAYSNRYGHLVLSTGNKSELAMGYSTLYGDMCGGLAVLADVTKEQVYLLAKTINREREIIPQSILEKPPSAELRPDQKDSDTLPEYPILDKVLRLYLEDYHSPQEIAKEVDQPLSLVQDLICRIHQNEYKRRQAPPGLRVTKKAFSIGRRFPIVQQFYPQTSKNKDFSLF